jgi:hypothetical protein
MAKLLAAAAMVVVAASSVHGSNLRHKEGPSAMSMLEENMRTEDMLDTASFVSFETGASDGMSEDKGEDVGKKAKEDAATSAGSATGTAGADVADMVGATATDGAMTEAATGATGAMGASGASGATGATGATGAAADETKKEMPPLSHEETSKHVKKAVADMQNTFKTLKTIEEMADIDEMFGETAKAIKESSTHVIDFGVTLASEYPNGMPPADIAQDALHELEETDTVSSKFTAELGDILDKTGADETFQPKKALAELRNRIDDTSAALETEVGETEMKDKKVKEEGVETMDAAREGLEDEAPKGVEDSKKEEAAEVQQDRNDEPEKSGDDNLEADDAKKDAAPDVADKDDIKDEPEKSGDDNLESDDAKKDAAPDVADKDDIKDEPEKSGDDKLESDDAKKEPVADAVA